MRKPRYPATGGVLGSNGSMTNEQREGADLESICHAVLKVARLGEVDHRGWWGTRSFGAAGRVVLQPRLPRTWRMAAVELDIKAATVRHNDVIDRLNAVHLFSDNWHVRRWASAWVAEQKTAAAPDVLFEELEMMDVEQLVVGLGQPPEGLDMTGRAVRVGSIGRRDFDSLAMVHAAVVELASVYVGLNSEFLVPYLEITP